MTGNFFRAPADVHSSQIWKLGARLLLAVLTLSPAPEFRYKGDYGCRRPSLVTMTMPIMRSGGRVPAAG